MSHSNLMIILCLCLCWSCTPSGAQSNGSQTGLPSRSELVNLSWRADTCIVAYPAGDEAAEYQNLLSPLTQHKSRRGPALRLIADDQLTDSLLAKYPLILLSTGQHALPIQQLPDLHLHENQLILGASYPIEANQAAFINYLPGTGGQPVHLIYSTDKTLLQQLIRAHLLTQWPRFLWRGWGYQIFQEERIIVQGYFNDANWTMDRQLHFDFRQEATLLDSIAGLTIKGWSNSDTDLKPFLDDYQRIREKITADWGHASASEVLVYIYPSVENKALRTQVMDPAHFDEDTQQLHFVDNSHFESDEWGDQYRPLLRATLGTPKYELLESGLALHYRTRLYGRDWRAYARQLAEAEALVTPAQQAATDWREYRPLVGLLSAAAWVDFLIHQLDQATFRTYYTTGQLSGLQSEWEEQWQTWVLKQYPQTPNADAPLPKSRLNGFTFAHEGYRIFNGYGGSQSDASLRALKELGTNAIAIVPYSYMRDPRRATAIPVMRDAGTENDAAVLHAHFEAQELGQFTLLKPQLWINGAWPGDVEFATDTEWQDFFHFYREWALHYALLAEIYGFDAYCIGTELRHATLQQPKAWRALIRDIRKVYSGLLTYAANWGEECEQLSFWSELDFIGVNCYYPLHKDSVATDADLAKGAAAIMDRLQRLHQQYQRPLWLTEVGYRSATSPWMMPHAEAEARAIDEAAQARCYAALLAAMDKERDWLQGMFWWKWPCHLDHDESEGRGYMPLGKPAEAVVKRYF